MGELKESVDAFVDKVLEKLAVSPEAKEKIQVKAKVKKYKIDIKKNISLINSEIEGFESNIEILKEELELHDEEYLDHDLILQDNLEDYMAYLLRVENKRKKIEADIEQVKSNIEDANAEKARFEKVLERLLAKKS